MVILSIISYTAMMRSVFEPITVIKDWLSAQFEMQIEHSFLWWPVALGAGIGLYFALPSEPDPLLCGAAVVLSVMMWLKTRHDTGRMLCFALVLFTLGIAAGSFRAHSVYTPILQDKMRFAGIEGEIVSVEPLSANRRSARMILRDVKIEDLLAERTPRRVRLTVRSSKDLPLYHPGDKVSALVSLHVLSDPLVPEGFDFRRHLYFQKIGATGFFYGAPEIVGKNVDNAWTGRIQAMRSSLYDLILQRIPERSPEIVGALMTGHKAAISDRDMEAMRGSGLAHMLAISGLHVGLFSASLFFVVRLLLVLIPGVGLMLPVKKIAAVIAFTGACFYMLLAGATIPTQRAVLMVGIVFLAIFLDRSALSMRLVSFAALCILLIFPESLLSISFQLSFAAVMALIWVYDALRPWMAKISRGAGAGRKVGLYVGGIILTSCIASIATAPFSLYAFQQVALYGVLGNLLAMPILGILVMPCAVLTLVSIPFGLEALALELMGYGAGWILEIARFVSGLEGAQLTVAAMPFSVFLSTSLAGLGLILLRGSVQYIAFMAGIICAFLAYDKRFPTIYVSAGHELYSVFYAADKTVDNIVDKSARPDRLYVSSLQKKKFDRDTWQRFYGLERKHVKHWRSFNDVRCDEDACRLIHQGKRISFIRHKAVTQTECAWADILITPRSLRAADCATPYVIDHWRVKHKGAQVVYFSDDGSVTIEPVFKARGLRLWR